MSALYLTNTLTRQKELFTPIDPKHIGMYVCGPTVYDFAHLGNARPVVVFDTLYRLLKRHYPRVTYVRNITDVDDKIMAKAKESGEPIENITRRTTDAYHEDMAALNALSPDIEPRATQHIGGMIALI
jgi:cysteinyl-tRNA synthetase